MSTNGLRFDLVRIGDTVYIRGSDEFYKHFAGAAVAQLLHGKWLKAPATRGRLKSIAPLTSIAALFAGISSHHGKLANDGKTTYKGQDVVAIRDTSDDSKLYVAATGKPYPVAIVGGKKASPGRSRSATGTSRCRCRRRTTRSTSRSSAARRDYAGSSPGSLATTRGTPTVSDALDSGSTSSTSASSSSRTSVSFSSSAVAIRSSAARCLRSSRTASS